MRTSKSEYRYKTVIKRCFFGLKKHLFLMRFFVKKAFDCVYKPQAPSRVLRLYFYFAGLFPRLCTPKEKRKMKKLLSLLLCAALCVSAMTACGSNQADRRTAGNRAEAGRGKTGRQNTGRRTGQPLSADHQHLQLCFGASGIYL